MPIIFFNKPVFDSQIESVKKDGTFVLYLKTLGKGNPVFQVVKSFISQDCIKSNDSIHAQFSWFQKGHHTFLFLNPVRKSIHDERVYGIFINDMYGYEVIEGEEINVFEYEHHRKRDVRNLTFKAGVYRIGVTIQLYSSTGLNGKCFKLTRNGWEAEQSNFVEPTDMKRIAGRYNEEL